MDDGITNSNIRDIWSDILDELRGKLSEKQFTKWLKPLRPQYFTEQKLCFSVDEAFHRQWVLDNHKTLLEEVAGEVLHTSISVQIYVTGQLKLPNISPQQAIIPNSLARSALFGVQGRGMGDYLEQSNLEAWKNITIRYTGPQLDQHDLDVWLQCLRRISDDELGKPIEFTAHGFIKEMGKAVGSYQYEMLNRRLTRLRATALDVQIGEEGYVGGLLDRYYRHDGSGRFVIIADPLIASLFKNDQYAWLNWEQRMQLRGQLSKFLHAYLPTHSTDKAPHFISVNKLKKLSRSKTKHLWKFRQMLRKACEELAEVDALEDWWISENDVAHFIRSGSRSLKD